tara:strand:+ start:4344 stop:5867 length:1524 start_codon:yes stop_codon:yes gene_type:complete
MIQIFPSFLFGVLLMFIGYFYPYSTLSFQIYNLFLLLLFGIVFITINRNNFFFSFYMWLFFLLLFPKKPVLSILDSLLTNGINLSENFLIPTSFSFYHIINFFILFAISHKVFKSFKIDLNDLSKRLFLLFSSLFFAALISALYYNLYLSNFLSTNYLAQFDYLLHIYEGLIFSIVIFLGVKHKEDYHTIYKLLLLTLLITISEFLLARFTDLLPDAIKYFSLNFRGAIRSIIHDGSIPTGMIIFYGLLGLLGLLNKNKRLIYVLPFFAITSFNTYERSSILLGLIAFGTYLFFRFRSYLSFNITMTTLGFLLFIILVFPKDNLSRLSDSFDEGFNANMDGSTIKVEGWFTFSSSGEREGALKRGMDVFYFNPFLGAGPGNLETLMSSSMVPMNANFHSMSLSEFQFYNNIASGNRPTDSHNLYVRIIAEYGIFGIMFLLFFLHIILFSIYNQKTVNNINSIGIAGIYAIFAYGFFQTFPISYPMLILFLSMITFKNQSIEQNNITA